MNNVIKFANCKNTCEGGGACKFVCESKSEQDCTCVNLFK